jgi:hypothetical protein
VIRVNSKGFEFATYCFGFSGIDLASIPGERNFGNGLEILHIDPVLARFQDKDLPTKEKPSPFFESCLYSS